MTAEGRSERTPVASNRLWRPGSRRQQEIHPIWSAKALRFAQGVNYYEHGRAERALWPPTFPIPGNDSQLRFLRISCKPRAAVNLLPERMEMIEWAGSHADVELVGRFERACDEDFSGLDRLGEIQASRDMSGDRRR